MEWFTLVSTAFGAILGVGASTLNERMKWKRERSKTMYESRSKLYAEYLADLTKTRDAIRLVARGIHTTGISRREAVEGAFASANIYARRYQIRITAGEPVAAAASEALRALRGLRDAVGEGHEPRSERYDAEKAQYGGALATLMNVMQEDLRNMG